MLVTDNLNTHSPACLYERFSPEQARRIAQKIEWHYTPEHGSWLNMAECELSVLASLSPPPHRHAAQVTVQWHFTTADARIKLKRLDPVLKEQNSAYLRTRISFSTKHHPLSKIQL